MVAMVAAIGILVAACGHDSTSATATPPASDSPAAIAASITLLDQAGLHDIDTQLNAGKVPPTAQTAASHAQAVLVITAWPPELKAQASDLAATLGVVAKGLNTDTPDLKAVGAAATRAHNGEHEFSHAVWAWLSAKAGISPSASGTASAGTPAH
jgi:hypothetical protein